MWQAVFRPGSKILAKPEWGLKRTCQHCGTRFYDMGADTPACPKCGTKFDPDAVMKTKRTTKAVAEKAAPPPKAKPKPKPAEDEELEAVADEVPEGEEAAEGEEEEVIEDTSELGEDDEDVADVIENVDEDEEGR
jgi:uncharacterized protein (TIGR02300 family)